MVTGPTRVPAREAGEWLHRLSRDGETLDHFLAWRADPTCAEAFDKLAAKRFALWAAERQLVAAMRAREDVPQTITNKMFFENPKLLYPLN